ncbi:MAG: hypothetical protein AB7V45_06780 [Candidatus Krumholzibacteriia bacterium]
MTTYVVRFPGGPDQGFKGIVRHVASGEECRFGSPEDLVRFMTGMNAVGGWEARRSVLEDDLEGPGPLTMEGNRKGAADADPKP